MGCHEAKSRGEPEEAAGPDLNRLRLQQVVTMFNAGETLCAGRVLSPDYVDHQKPAFIATEGPEEFVTIVALARRSLPNLHVSIEEVVVEGDRLAARLRWPLLHRPPRQTRTRSRTTLATTTTVGRRAKLPC